MAPAVFSYEFFNYNEQETSSSGSFKENIKKEKVVQSSDDNNVFVWIEPTEREKSPIYEESITPIIYNALDEIHSNRKKQKTIININLLIEKKREEMKMMQHEIERPIKKFETFVTKLSIILFLFFLLLSLPFLVGAPAVVGVIMSLGLYVFSKIRKWERGEYTDEWKTP